MSIIGHIMADIWDWEVMGMILIGAHGVILVLYTLCNFLQSRKNIADKK